MICKTTDVELSPARLELAALGLRNVNISSYEEYETHVITNYTKETGGY